MRSPDDTDRTMGAQSVGTSDPESDRTETLDQVERTEASPPPPTVIGQDFDSGLGPRPSRRAPDSWFPLLRSVVEELEQRGRVPRAAGVSARMRQRDPQFSPDRTEMKSFRGFLERAAAAGVISFERSPDGADFVIRSGAATGNSATSEWVRQDVWRAALDWSPESNYALEQMTGAVLKLQPGVAASAGQCVIPRFDRAAHLRWMREFANNMADGEAKSDLLLTLEREDPIQEFNKVVRSSRPIWKAWRRDWRQRITAGLVEWANRSGIALAELMPVSASMQPSPTSRSLLEQASIGRDGLSAQRQLDEADVGTRLGDVDVRRIVVRAIERMPLADVLRLPIPIEYMIQ